MNDDDDDDEDDDDEDDDDVVVGATGLGLKLGGLSTTALGNSGGSSSSSSALGPSAKAQCSGKDIQTAECRGEFCQIGKDGKRANNKTDLATDRQT